VIDQLNSDLKDAMRAKDAVRLTTIRLLKSAIEYYKIEKKQEELSDADLLGVLKKQIKQRQDSIEGFEKGGRPDLVAKEKEEVAILSTYLPEQLSEAQLQEIVQTTITELGASTKADMGKVMKCIQEKVAGRADNRMISQLVSSKLA